VNAKEKMHPFCASIRKAISPVEFARNIVRVVEVVGKGVSEKAVSLIALLARDIPYIFPQDAIEEAKRAKPTPLGTREDMRHIPFMTIDPVDAKDHDDAVYAEPTEDGHIIYVAIADVAAFVTPKSAIDEEALKRGNSVYFPDRVVPMLPEELSTDLCSLKPNQDRAALVCKIHINAKGKKLSHSFHRVLMRSHEKFHYALAQEQFEAGKPALQPLYAAYKSLCVARDKRQPLDLDLPERKIKLNEKGEVEGVLTPLRLDAHRLIEEMMVLANVCAAETLQEHKIPCLYRIHDTPSDEKLFHLKEFLVAFDVRLPKANTIRANNFNQILAKAKDTPSQDVVNMMILRSQAQAEYNPENIGHFGLNLMNYAHFTSPIRRYADLYVHRGLIRALKLGDDGLTDAEMKRAKMIGEEISLTERRAMAAERETIERLITAHLSNSIGEIFQGRISGMNNAGLFIKLSETGAEGFIPVSMIGDDYFIYDDKNKAMVGRHSGVAYDMGARVFVKLIEAAPLAGALRFTLVEDEGSAPRRVEKRAVKQLEQRPERRRKTLRDKGHKREKRIKGR
jgi:ribonuclease R